MSHDGGDCQPCCFYVLDVFDQGLCELESTPLEAVIAYDYSLREDVEPCPFYDFFSQCSLFLHTYFQETDVSVRSIHSIYA